MKSKVLCSGLLVRFNPVLTGATAKIFLESFNLSRTGPVAFLRCGKILPFICDIF